jgi:hypothetical protein
MASQPSHVPSQTRAGMPVWVKVLLVLAVLFVLGIAAVAGAGYYFFRKLADEPGGARAAVLRMANPDYEIVEVDEKDKQIRVRHKKTGKEGTIPLDRLERGSVISPKDVGLTNDEAGLKAPPAWAQYPEATVESTAGDAHTTQIRLKTDDPAEKVFEYYETQLKANGYEVSSVSLTKTISGTSKDKHSTVVVQILPGAAGKTGILVVLQEEKQ